MEIILFVWSAILFGVFVRCLQTEILLNPHLTPRSFWGGCLCVSSAGLLLVAIDPLGALGIYPLPLLWFLSRLATMLVLNSLSCAFYLYLIVLYTQYLDHVPERLYIIWLGVNTTLSLLLAFTAIIGSATNNNFWYGFGGMFIILHEICSACLINASLSRLTKILQNMTHASNDLILRVAIRKIRLIRLIAVVLCALAVGNQIFGTDGFVTKLVWGAPIPAYPTSEFLPTLWFPHILIALAHVFLLYIFRRPQKKADATLERIEVPSQSTVS